MTQKAPALTGAFFHAAAGLIETAKVVFGCNKPKSAAHSKGRQRSCEQQRRAYDDRERRAGLPLGRAVV